MGSQFLSIVPERTGSAMLTPVRGSHKGTEVHCPNAQRDAQQSSPVSRPEYRFCRDEDLDEPHSCDVGAFALAANC